jgi:hypothetical protein
MSSQKECEISGQKAMLARDAEPPVYLLADGRFAVQIEGKWRLAGSMKTIDKALSDSCIEKKSLAVFLEHEPDKLIEVVRIVARGRGRELLLKDGNTKSMRWRSFYMNNEKVRKAIREHNAKSKKIDAERAKVNAKLADELAAIMEGAKRVTDENFDELMRKHGR